MILDVMETCQSTSFYLILPIIKRGLLVIQIIVPILLILMATIQFLTMTTKPDDKKNYKSLLNKVIAALIVFFIPVFINTIMGLVGESTEFSKCWTAADETRTIKQNNYVDDDDERVPIINSGDWEGSDKEDTSSKKNSNKNSTNSTKSDKVVFVGDSRTVGMYITKSGNGSGNYSSGGAKEVDKDVYLAQESKGLDWLKSTGMPAAEKYMTSGTAVVILMGVNDTYNIDNYISYLKSNASNWTGKGAKIYYAAVTPCDGGSKSLNTSIQNFNSKLESNLPSDIKWIDTYSYLNSKGFKTTDGVHYNGDTYNTIYNYIKSAV